jgi:hypothetical protein
MALYSSEPTRAATKSRTWKPSQHAARPRTPGVDDEQEQAEREHGDRQREHAPAPAAPRR